MKYVHAYLRSHYTIVLALCHWVMLIVTPKSSPVCFHMLLHCLLPQLFVAV